MPSWDVLVGAPNENVLREVVGQLVQLGEREREMRPTGLLLRCSSPSLG